MSYAQIIADTLQMQGIPQNAIPLIVAQSKHESANYTSNVFKANNNAFGMKQPKVRPTTSIGGGTAAPSSEGTTPYARYKDVADSAKDLVLWLQYNRVDLSGVTTAQQYATILKDKGYYGNTMSEYITGVTYYLGKAGDYTLGVVKANKGTFFFSCPCCGNTLSVQKQNI